MLSLLTFCPPGPGEREVCTVIHGNSMVMSSFGNPMDYRPSRRAGCVPVRLILGLGDDFQRRNLVRPVRVEFR